MTKWSVELINSPITQGSNGSARYCRWKINGKDLETPALYASHYLNSRPEPWQVPGLKTFLLNAHDLYPKNIINRLNGESIHEFLAKNSKEAPLDVKRSVIFLDSGGFSFLRQGGFFRIKRRKPQWRTLEKEALDFRNRLKALYSTLKPDLAAVLDFPIDPNRPTSTLNRAEFTCKSIKEMAKWQIPLEGTYLTVMPVIHPIHDELRLLESGEVWEAIRNSPAIGIGSLIPLLMHRKKAGRRKALEAIEAIIQKIRNSDTKTKYVHVFGVGGATSMHLAFYLGADSVDCAGWRTRAAWDIIQLPGTGDRYISEQRRAKRAWKGIRVIANDEKKQLLECLCTACRLARERGDQLKVLDASFRLRALHNLYVYQKEVEVARTIIKRGRYEDFRSYKEFIIERSKTSTFLKSFLKLIE